MLRWFYYEAQQFRWVLDQESIQRYPHPVLNKKGNIIMAVCGTKEIVQISFSNMFTSTLMKVEFVMGRERVETMEINRFSLLYEIVLP